MKGLRTLGVLVALLGGLAAYLYYVDAEKPVGEAEEKPKVFAVEADQIEELKVSTIAGGVAELKKSADGWYLSGPQHIRADDSEVTGITSNLATVSIQRVVDENPSNLGDYGLREPVAEVSFKAKGAKEFTTLQIGTKSPTGSDLYAKTANEKKVFLISGYLESTLNRTPFDLRDKKIISFDRDKVDRIEIRHGKSLVSLVKAKGEWRMNAPVDARGDFGAIEGLISKLQSTQMKAIVTEDPAEFSKYGIDSPTGEVTLVSGSAKAVVAFGTKTADNFIYVRDQSKPLVVTAPADLFDEIEKGPTEYRRKDLFEFRAFNLDRLEITRDAATVVFERLKGKGKDGADAWQNATTRKAVDAAKFEAFLTKLSGTRAQSFADDKTKTGLDAPAVRLKATFEEGKKNEMVTIGRVAAEVFAGRTDEPGAAKLDATEFDETLKALDEFK
jgi:Domain of unknown function (DUF4340)